MSNTNLPSARRRIRSSIPFIITLLVLLYLGLNAWIYFYGTTVFNFSLSLKKAAQTVSVVKEQGFGSIVNLKPTPTPVPRVISPLPTGTQSWKLSRGKAVTGPQIQTATVDPLTPNKGVVQTITITAKNDSPITATATLTTDNKHQSSAMKLTSGTSTEGTWSVSWKMDDTYNYIYHIDFVLQSATGDWTGALTFR
jgi:hypothetical protein